LYFISPYSFQPWVYQSLPAQLGHAAHVKKVLNLIPQDASVSTSGYIVSHLWGRRNIIGLEVMQMKDEEGKVVDVDYALLDLWQLQPNNLKVPVDRGRVPGECVLPMKLYGEVCTELPKYWTELFEFKNAYLLSRKFCRLGRNCGKKSNR
jgi:hypothetical protein